MNKQELIKKIEELKEQRKSKEVKTIYYNEHGQVDKFTTYINNHDWCLPVFFTIMIILCGLIEGM